MAAVAICAALAVAPVEGEPLPASLAGAWRITRVLPTSQTGCWTAEQGRDLVGSTLVYSASAMRWRGGEVPLAGIVTRQLTAAGSGKSVTLAQLGIRGDRVLEVDLQHEDMDITGASTEVPGDSVLVSGPNRIVVSACGVFMEAARTAGNASLHASPAR